jgi:HSP20 family protein
MINWEPLDELTWLRESVNRMTGRVVMVRTRAAAQMPSWAPPVEVFETAGEVLVRIRIPGVDTQTLRVEVWGNRVAIKGEATHGVFRRVVLLPVAVDPSTGRAVYRHGLLEVRIGKSQQIKPHMVTVEVG